MTLQSNLIIRDITQLNPITVAHCIRPTSIEDIQEHIKTYPGGICIGGGRFSMGGQVASEDCLHIDMRKFNQVLAFSPEERTITVQTGITWREILEIIDPHSLSIKIMQTYANFTVGGSLSVNAHGRYVGQGPLIFSVLSIKILLANGEIIDATPEENAGIFHGAIGGYGGLGVIVEATLTLAPNVKMEQVALKMSLKDYHHYFFQSIRDNPKAIFHNADIYPPEYQRVRAITWFETDKELTSSTRIVRPKRNYLINRYFIWAIMTTPLGKWRREYIIDPLIYLSKRVIWRNAEASGYNVSELEPRSRKKITDVLQEYFIPVNHIYEFMPKATEILQRYKVNVLNISIRHAKKDPGSLMAWAADEVFAFVLYYRQGVSKLAQMRVGLWARELINAALSCGGTYYLPYQLHATYSQFYQAYPRATQFFTLKNELDPQYKFRNKLWDKYYLTWLNKTSSTTMTDNNSEFKAVYSSIEWQDKFYLFLQNVYSIYPDDKFHALIKEAVDTYQNDKEIYLHIQKNLPNIKPVLSDIRYALPALFKQKRVIAKQTLQLLGETKAIQGYVEIGSIGRYISALRKSILVKDPIYLINDSAPSYSPADIMERGQISQYGQYFPLNDYDPISETIPNESVDLVTCYIGLHHAPLDKLDAFVRSIYRILRKNGLFIIRDHDVNTPQMHTFVSLVHTVFNSGLNIPYADNCKEIRLFTSINELSSYLVERGFKATEERLLQENDPSQNTLLKFLKN